MRPWAAWTWSFAPLESTSFETGNSGVKEMENSEAEKTILEEYLQARNEEEAAVKAVFDAKNKRNDNYVELEDLKRKMHIAHERSMKLYNELLQVRATGPTTNNQ